MDQNRTTRRKENRLPSEEWVMQLKFPPMTTFLLRFQFRVAAERRFSHTVFVNGLISRIFGHPLPGLHQQPLPRWMVIPNPVESGQVRYEAGDFYHVGVTFIGHGIPDLRALAVTIEAGMTDRSGRQEASEPAPVRFVDVVPVVPSNVGEQIQELQGRHRLTLHFTTPLRIEQKFRDEGTSKHFDRDYFDPAHFFKTLGRRAFDVSKLAREDPDPLEDREPPPVTLASNHLLWLRVPSPVGEPSAPQYFGAVGKVELEGDFTGWEESLILGQYCHLGKSTNFGFGRYVIRELDDIRRGDVRPARSLLSTACATPALRESWDVVRSKGGCAGTDGVTIDQFDSTSDGELEAVSGQVLRGEYSPSPLLGVVIEKEEGRARALAVPTVLDRVVQRAAVHCLGPSVDQLFEDCSYAFRKGFSRFDAVAALERAREEGYCHAVRADIEAFFDSVDWSGLINKLEALFPGEPLIDLITMWVTSPVVFRGKTIKRGRGLPQGAPVSPLLANLYLDEFDEEMEALGFRLIRYADDFVLLCKSHETAMQALEAAKKSLTDLDLKLNMKKTCVTDFDHGFRYLGFLFWRSIVLESPESAVDTRDSGEPPIVDEDEYAPPTSWRKEIGGFPPFATPDNANRGRSSMISPLSEEADEITDGDSKEPLYLDSPDLQIRCGKGVLLVQKPGSEVAQVPLEHLSHIVVSGAVRMSLPAVLQAAQAGVPVFFARRSGVLFAAVDPRPANWRLLQAQAAACDNGDLVLEFSRQVVMAKLNNQAVVLRSRRDTRIADNVNSIMTAESKCRRLNSLEELRGQEGVGAKSYFAGLRILIPKEWGFKERQKHPAPDPVNALLSFGYSLLYYRLSAALQIAGLNPALGLFHYPSKRYHPLASDLQEEFRHLADSLVLRVIRKGEICRDDFLLPEGARGGCFLNNQARKRFIAAFEQRLRDTFTPSGATEPISYRTFMEKQAQQIGDLVRGRTGTYKPLRIR